MRRRLEEWQLFDEVYQWAIMHRGIIASAANFTFYQKKLIDPNPAQFTLCFLSLHKCDMVKGKGEDCGFCRHWAREHQGAPADLSCLRVLLLDQVCDPGPKEEDFPNLKRVEGKWMANLGSLYSMDREHGTNIRDDAKPKQHWRD